jgi:hypothetical protein
LLYLAVEVEAYPRLVAPASAEYLVYNLQDLLKPIQVLVVAEHF